MEVFLGRQRRKKHISIALLTRTVFYYYLFNGEGKKKKKKKLCTHHTPQFYEIHIWNPEHLRNQSIRP